MSRRRQARIASDTPRDVAEALHGRPLREFVQARNALAADLRRAGRAKEAAAVAKLAKPSVAVWATNQLARRDPEAIACLVEAVDRLARAHLGKGSSLADTTRHQRDVLRGILEHAGDVLAVDRIRPSAALTRRISDTLVGAAADRDARRDLARGTLTDERRPPGLEMFLTDRAAAVPVRPARAPGRSPVADRPSRARVGQAAGEATEQRALSTWGAQGAPQAPRRSRRSGAAVAPLDQGISPRALRSRRAAQRRATTLRNRLATLERKEARDQRRAEAAEHAAVELRRRLETLERRAREAQQAVAELRSEAARVRRELDEASTGAGS